jgi:hypothetical protein
MPVEINELHITTVIQEEAGREAASNVNLSDKEKQKIIAECVEKVMEILKEKNER